MPTLIWSKVKDGLDPSMKKKAYAFFEKLQEDDTRPGLHIEPIKGSVDERVRTGRVDDNFRCVLFKITSGDDSFYVIHGVWPHDKANAIAETVRLSMNPINGVPEVERVVDAYRDAATGNADPAVTAAPDTVSRKAVPVDAAIEDLAVSSEPSGHDVISGQPPQEAAPSWPAGLTPELLHAELGIEAGLAESALAAPTEAALTDVISQARVEWHGDALLELATGAAVEDVRATFKLDIPVDLGQGAEEEQLLKSLEHPAAQATFHWVKDDADLRQIIEAGDFGAWRLFLHPEQRKYVDADYKGAFRLSGGAGTGKTVVAVHRAHRLAANNPQARVLLTTYTRNLADDLAASLLRLDDQLKLQSHLREPGIVVKGIDAVAWAVVQRAEVSIEPAVAEVLGEGRTSVLGSSRPGLWDEALAEAGSGLPPELATETFLETEYALVILPNSITSETEYVRVRRAGRGVALDRAKRKAVWGVVERYRSKARADGTTDFDEKAAIACAWLEQNGPIFDHVLVDEAQDLTPSRLRLLRALVADGRNDLFICEDSHQRIYGQKVTLSHVGINIRGRSRRLTLNYRTTAQNLRWAMGILSAGAFTDMEGEDEAHGYRSARSGPVPHLIEAPSMAGELDIAAELIQSWLPGSQPMAEGRAPAPEAIAVLVPDRWVRSNVVNGLAERGLDARSVEQENVKPGKPLVMTMHRAKGLEFTHVLLFGVHEGAVPRVVKDYEVSEQDKADALLRQRSLVYVAATRARDVLAVTWSGARSPFIG